MKFRMQYKSMDWWFWAVTLCFIGMALIGWDMGYNAVIGISAAQVLYFSVKQRSLVSFDVQVRIVYFAMTLLGLWQAMRMPFYIFLLIGTAMVVFLGRCGIALVLRVMPWNREPAFCSLEKDPGKPGS